VFVCAQLAQPQLAQPLRANAGRFPRTILVGDVFANRSFVSTELLLMRVKERARFFVDLAMAFRE
jgi:hypothetical protein